MNPKTCFSRISLIVLTMALLSVLSLSAIASTCPDLLRPDFVPTGPLTASQKKVYDKIFNEFSEQAAKIGTGLKPGSPLPDILYAVVKRFEGFKLTIISVSYLGCILAVEGATGTKLLAVKMAVTERMGTAYEKAARLRQKLGDDEIVHHYFPEIYASPDAGVQYLEFVHGVPMDEFMKSQTTGFKSQFKEMHYLMQEMAKSVALLHERGVVHWDIKPTNFMILPNKKTKSFLDSRIVLIDFDTAGEESDAPSDAKASTLGFVPPYRIWGGTSPLRSDDQYALRVSSLLLLVDPAIADRSINTESFDAVYDLNSPFSYDTTVSPILSAIAFHPPEEVKDWLEALDKAAQFHEAGDPVGFLSWYWVKHIEPLDEWVRNRILESSPEYDLVFHPERQNRTLPKPGFLKRALGRVKGLLGFNNSK